MFIDLYSNEDALKLIDIFERARAKSLLSIKSESIKTDLNTDTPAQNSYESAESFWKVGLSQCRFKCQFSTIQGLERNITAVNSKDIPDDSDINNFVYIAPEYRHMYTGKQQLIF